MSNQTNDNLREKLRARSKRADERLKFLWLPGRRSELAAESYDLGYSWREQGETSLAAKSFQRAVDAFEGKSPRKTKASLKSFMVVASCQNHIGLIHLDANGDSDAISWFDRAIELRRELQQLFPDNRENQIYLGGALCNRAWASKSTDHPIATAFFEQSLSELRQPEKTCECSYWDEKRKSWWCDQLEALGRTAGLAWVDMAPMFIDNAQAGLDSIKSEKDF